MIKNESFTKDEAALAEPLYGPGIEPKRLIDYDLMKGVEYGPIAGVFYDVEKELHCDEGVNNDSFHTQWKRLALPTEPKVVTGVNNIHVPLIRADQGWEIFSNFAIKLEKRICSVQDVECGEEFEYSYKLNVCIFLQNGKRQFFEADVPGDQVKDVEWLKKATRSLARLPRDKNEKIDFLETVQKCIESENAINSVNYGRCGWRNVLDLGPRFIFGGGAIGNEELPIKAEGECFDMDIDWNMVGTKKNFEHAMMTSDICKKKVASLGLFLFTHASLLESLFEEAGYPIRFVMGISGVTNSRKTSMTLAICKIFGKERKKADAEFATSTACGIETLLGKYKDGVVVIDDFKPPVNAAQQAQMNEKLDQLVRMYGDRVPKTRMSAPNHCNGRKYFPVSGGCVVTMEIVTGVTSSLTRLFVVGIGKDDVCNDILGFFQKNGEILPTHYYSFLRWITEHYSAVVKHINTKFEFYRGQKRYSIGRYNEMLATFCTVAELLGIYAQQQGFYTSEESSAFVENTYAVMCNEIDCMGEELIRRDKVQIIAASLEEALRSGQVIPKPLEPQYCAGKFDCYEDSELLYIRSITLKYIADVFCRKYNEVASISGTDELIGILLRHDLLVINEKADGKTSRKLPKSGGNSLRYLYIKKNKLLSILQE